MLEDVSWLASEVSSSCKKKLLVKRLEIYIEQFKSPEFELIDKFVRLRMLISIIVRILLWRSHVAEEEEEEKIVFYHRIRLVIGENSISS